jgi:hypothetical protein
VHVIVVNIREASFVNFTIGVGEITPPRFAVGVPLPGWIAAVSQG